MECSEEEFENWWDSPIGVEVRKWLKKRIIALSNEALTLPVVEKQVTTATYLGRKLELEFLLELDFKKLAEES